MVITVQLVSVTDEILCTNWGYVVHHRKILPNKLAPAVMNSGLS